MYFFGNLGLLSTVLGGGILAFLAVEKVATGHDMIAVRGPLMAAGGLLLLAGLMMFSTGLMGEVLMRTYFESQGRRIYAVREIRCRPERRAQNEPR
jgi:hypothetical protein